MDLAWICPLSVRRPRGGPRDARLKLIYLTTGPQGLKGGVGGIYSFDSAPNTSSPRGMFCLSEDDQAYTSRQGSSSSKI